MPADFDKCESDGGKIITKTIGKNKYIHVCYDKAGKSHRGEVKTKMKTTISKKSSSSKTSKKVKTIAKKMGVKM